MDHANAAFIHERSQGGKKNPPPWLVAVFYTEQVPIEEYVDGVRTLRQRPDLDGFAEDLGFTFVEAIEDEPGLPRLALPPPPPPRTEPGRSLSPPFKAPRRLDRRLPVPKAKRAVEDEKRGGEKETAGGPPSTGGQTLAVEDEGSTEKLGVKQREHIDSDDQQWLCGASRDAWL